jgi:signal transduction histidine kinase
MKKFLAAIGLLNLLLAIIAGAQIRGAHPRLEAKLDGQNRVLVSAECGGQSLEPGDRVLGVNGVAVTRPAQIDFVLDTFFPAGTARLEVERGAQKLLFACPLQPVMTASFQASTLAVALVFWIFAMLVLFFGRLERDAVLFFVMAQSICLLVASYWAENDFGLTGGRPLGMAVTYLLYPLTVTMLLHFSLGFPEYSGPKARKLAPLLYLPAVIVCALLMYTHLKARASLSAPDLEAHLAAQSLMRLYLAGVFVPSPVIWLRRLSREKEGATRQKFKLMLAGFSLGIAPHLLFFELPQGLGLRPVLPEQATQLFIVLAAASMIVAIARYRMFDINLIISRSLAYTVLSLFVAGAYLALMAGADELLAGRLEQQLVVRILLVLILAAAFEPVRRFFQDAIDRLFFSRSFEQRQALIELSRELARTRDIRKISELLCRLASSTLKARPAAVFMLDPQGQKLLPLYTCEGEPAGLLDAEKIISGLKEHQLLLDQKNLAGTGYGQAVVLMAEGRLSGLLALGPKADGLDFREDELRFLEAAAAEAALAFEAARALEELRRLNQNLEQKVFERTQQMAQANDRLVEQYLELERLDKLKESFTGMIVHDLKNPLTTICLGTEFMRQELRDDEQLTKNLRAIEGAARHMLSLVQSMLDTARMEAGSLRLELAQVPVSELLTESTAVAAFQAAAKEIRLELETPGQLSARVDRLLFVRVLENLLFNSIRHSPPRQVIKLQAEARAEGGVRFSVINYGPAIAPELQEKIFEKYFQADGGPRGSAGLGLYFCRLVTQAHGGSISVVSPLPGRQEGAQFVVDLPRAGLSSSS